MSLAKPIRIAAVVDETERPALVAAAEQLGESLGAAFGSHWPIELRFLDTDASLDLAEEPAVVVTSFLPEVARQGEPMSSISARWRAYFHSLMALPATSVFVCTVFRHVANGATQRQHASGAATVERIRRLNLLAAELSHETGIGVIDIDRIFAHLGARALGTDYRLTGPLAAEVAGHTIVSTMLACGLDTWVAPETQERAKRIQGNWRQIGRVVQRRLMQGARQGRA